MAQRHAQDDCKCTKCGKDGENTRQVPKQEPGCVVKLEREMSNKDADNDDKTADGSAFGFVDYGE